MLGVKALEATKSTCIYCLGGGEVLRQEIEKDVEGGKDLRVWNVMAITRPGPPSNPHLLQECSALQLESREGLKIHR